VRAVYSTLDVQHQLIVRIALKDAGIKFFIPNENAASWTSDVTLPAAPFVFEVSDEDFDAAAAVIREAIDRIRKKKPVRKQKKKT
jgi:hypothetical protein